MPIQYFGSLRTDYVIENLIGHETLVCVVEDLYQDDLGKNQFVTKIKEYGYSIRKKTYSRIYVRGTEIYFDIGGEIFNLDEPGLEFANMQNAKVFFFEFAGTICYPDCARQAIVSNNHNLKYNQKIMFTADEMPSKKPRFPAIPYLPMNQTIEELDETQESFTCYDGIQESCAYFVVPHSKNLFQILDRSDHPYSKGVIFSSNGKNVKYYKLKGQ